MADHYGRLTSTPKVASILLAMARRVKMKTLLPDENVVTWSWYFELLWSKDTLQFLWSTKGFWPISDPYSPKIEVDISDAPEFFFSLSQFSSKLFSFLIDGSELQEDCDSHCSIHSFMKVKQNYIYTTLDDRGVLCVSDDNFFSHCAFCFLEFVVLWMGAVANIPSAVWGSFYGRQESKFPARHSG